MAAGRWMGWLAAGLIVAAPGGSSWAQSWNLYNGTTSYFIPYWKQTGSNPNTYEQATMSSNPAGAQIFLSLNSGTPTLFTMDTGSSGIIANKYIMPTTGLTSLGQGSQYYDSSGVLLSGNYYLTNVRIMSSQNTVATTATVVALLATNQTCVFTSKNCTPNSDPTPAYMGVGFDRGVSAITPSGPNTNVNPFINVNASGPYSQGYLITNSGVYLGLTNALTANYAFVKLMPNPSPAGQASAAWLQAPMTIAVGGATGTGSILPDSGIPYAFLTAPAGANIATSPCPGGNCANAGVPVQIYLPGQTTPQIAFYNFTTGGSGNALQPDFVQTVSGPSVFLNTGREFYAGFNYFFDPVNGFVGYQWNQQVPSQYGFVMPIVALQGNVTLPASLSSTFPTYLMSNTTLSSPGTVVFQGNLFGPGGLTVASGDISLAGPSNTYQGGTTVNGGNLSLGPGATLPYASSLTMNGGTFNLNGNTQVLSSISGNGGTLAPGGGLLVLNTTQSNTLGSSLSGNGMFVVQGGGSLNLTGNSAGFSGATVVANAGLAVNGSLGGNVFAGPGGTVSGNGTIVGNLFNGGLLAPGNSIGTLTVSGNYSQNSAGVYTTEVVGQGQSDRLNVGGIANLGGTVFVTALPGLPFAPSTTYTILSAAGGLNGTFASVNELYPFLQSNLSYDANNAYLTLQVGGFAAQALNRNQYAVGTALDASAASATGDYAAVLGTLATATTAQGQAFMTSISGQNYSGFSSSMVQGAQLFMNNFATQAGGATGGRVALAEACDVACDTTSPALWGAWGGALGGLGTVGAGLSTGAVTYNLGGFAAGLDRMMTPNLRAGVTVGYMNGTQWVGGFTGQGFSNTVQAGLYGNYSQGNAYLDGLASYAYSANQMSRGIFIPNLPSRTAQGQTGANQVFGQVEGGYRVDLGGPVDAFVTPFARLQGYTGTQNAFSENGAQSLSLNVAAQTTNSLRSVLGAQLGGGVDVGWREKLVAQFRLGWSHEYADTARPVSAALAGAPTIPFTTYGASLQRDGVVVGVSANTAVAEATSVYLRYEGNISGLDSTHALTAGVRIIW